MAEPFSLFDNQFIIVMPKVSVAQLKLFAKPETYKKPAE